MNKHIIDTLDNALNLLRQNRQQHEITGELGAQSEAVQLLLETVQALDGLLPVQMPSSQALSADRQLFIKHARILGRTPVSPNPFIRLKEWIRSILPDKTVGQIPLRKERRIMSTSMLRVVAVLSLLFTFAGGTVAMANNSLPDSPLYATKLALEQFQLSLMSDPAKIASQHLVMAENRVQEMIQMALAGEVPEEGTRLRLEEHLNMALQLAAQLNDEGMLGVLTQAQNMVQNQTQQLTQTRARVGEQAQGPLGMTIQVMNHIRERLQAGQQDPAGFRNMYRYGDCEDCTPGGGEHKYGQDESESVAPLQDSDCVDCPIGDEHKYGQDGDRPDPPYKYQTGEDCEPAGDENKYGQEDSESVAPLQDSDCVDCPIGDEHKYGQDGSQPDPPFRNQDCDDCAPEGDENKYGQQENPPDPPHQNQDCQDCEPQGDENKYGQDESESVAPLQDSDCVDCPIGDEHKYGQDGDLPNPQNKYQTGEDCEPAGDENKYGQEGSESVAPLQDSDCVDCPIGDENKYGQDGSQPDPPFRNQDCDDCVPEGDEHKYGQPENPPDPNGQDNSQGGKPRP